MNRLLQRVELQLVITLTSTNTFEDCAQSTHTYFTQIMRSYRSCMDRVFLINFLFTSCLNLAVCCSFLLAIITGWIFNLSRNHRYHIVHIVRTVRQQLLLDSPFYISASWDHLPILLFIEPSSDIIILDDFRIPSINVMIGCHEKYPCCYSIDWTVWA